MVDRFQDGCGQTIEAYKKYQEAVTELAEARQELAEVSSALAQAQQQINLLTHRLVDFCASHLHLMRGSIPCSSLTRGSKGHIYD